MGFETRFCAKKSDAEIGELEKARAAPVANVLLTKSRREVFMITEFSWKHNIGKESTRSQQAMMIGTYLSIEGSVLRWS